MKSPLQGCWSQNENGAQSPKVQAVPPKSTSSPAQKYEQSRLQAVPPKVQAVPPKSTSSPAQKYKQSRPKYKQSRQKVQAVPPKSTSNPAQKYKQSRPKIQASRPKIQVVTPSHRTNRNPVSLSQEDNNKMLVFCLFFRWHRWLRRDLQEPPVPGPFVRLPCGLLAGCRHYHLRAWLNSGAKTVEVDGQEHKRCAQNEHVIHLKQVEDGESIFDVRKGGNFESELSALLSLSKFVSSWKTVNEFPKKNQQYQSRATRRLMNSFTLF